LETLSSAADDAKVNLGNNNVTPVIEYGMQTRRTTYLNGSSPIMTPRVKVGHKVPTTGNSEMKMHEDCMSSSQKIS
jgi:hypothetical protein